MHATYDGRITNVTVAGAGATGQGAAFALGGSVSVNRIRNTSEAVISNAAGVTTTGATATSLQVRADDTSKIWAMAGGVGVAIPQGGGVGVAAGVAVAKNEITSRTTASTVNSKITSSGGIAITADSVPTIFALSIGIGVAAGAGTGAALGGAGAGSGNLIDCTTEAFITGSLTRDVVANGGGVFISATDKSKILGVAGALAFAGQFGGGGVSASVGVSVVDNRITPHTHAYVDSSKVSASGGLTLHSSHDATIKAYAIGGSISATTGGQGGIALAIAATVASNTITVDAGSWIANSQTGTGAAAPNGIIVETVQGSDITAYSVAVSVSVGAGLTNVALSGGGASSANTIGGTAEAYVSNSSISSRGGVTLTATNTAHISAKVAAVSASISGGGIGTAAAIGASLATNTITGSTLAYLNNSTVSASGAITISAAATQTIEAFVLAGAAAVSGAIGGGAALGGAGATSVNKVGMAVKAFIDGDGTGGVRGSSIAITAPDSSSIDVNVAAASIAAAVGGVVSGAVSIGVSLARNTVSNDVQAFIKNADTGVGGTALAAADVTISATERAGIRARSTAASLAVGIGGFGAAVRGAGAEATNVVLTKANAYVDASIIDSAKNVTISSLSTGVTLFDLPTSLTPALLNTYASMDRKVALAAQADLPAVTAERAAAVAPIDTALRAAFTGRNTLAEGDILISALDPTTQPDSAWSVTGASAWQVLDADYNLFILTRDGDTIRVSRPLITAQVVSASIAAAGGIGAGVAASIGASRVQNLIGWNEDGTKAPAEIRSYVSNSSIKATGVLSQSALNSATIDASAFAGSIAASGGGSGTSLGGAGASIVNKIATRVEATIDGDGATGITVGSASLRATDASMISSSAGAAAVSASFGAAGVAVSIGVGLAANTVANTVDVSIRNADQGVTATTGGVTLAADSRATIAATAWAASVALSGAAGVSISSSNAGVNASNTLENTVRSHVDNSKIDITKTDQSLSVTATETSSLSALGVAAAVSFAGGFTGVAVGLGGGTASNTVKNTVEAYVTLASRINSALTATGSGAVTIRATANETLRAQLVGAAGAVTAGATGSANAVAVAVVSNTLANTVQAYVSGGVVRSPGALTVDAASTGTLTANAFAAAASMAITLGGVALSAGGAGATNTIDNTVTADVLGGSTLAAGGAVSITATNTATFNASVTAVALSGGVMGGSIGASTIRNADTSDVTAQVSKGTVSRSSGVTIAATANDFTGTMLGVATSTTIALGSASAGVDAKTEFSPTLVAAIGLTSDVSATSGTVTVAATLTSDAKATTYGAAGGLVAIGTSTGTATANGSVSALVDGTVSGRTIAVTARANTAASVSSTGLAGGIVSGSGAESTAISSPTVTARASTTSVLRGGPDVGTVATPAASILIDATANPSARAESMGVAVGLLGGVGISVSTATVAPTVTAAVNSAGTKGLAADALTVRATLAPVESGRRTADAKAIAGGGGYYGIGGSNASAIGGGSVTSRIGDAVRLPDGDVTVVASGTTRQKSDATAIAVGFYGVGAAVSSAVGQVTTLAQLGTGIASSALRRGDLVVAATGDNQNTAASTGGSGGAIAGNASTAATRDTSTAAATILGTKVGEAISAGTIRVTADQLTDYSLGAFSVNVAMVGASGAFGSNTSATSATTTIGTGTTLTASDSGEAVRIASRNRFSQFQTDYSAQGGAGGQSVAQPRSPHRRSPARRPSWLATPPRSPPPIPSGA